MNMAVHVDANASVSLRPLTAGNRPHRLGPLAVAAPRGLSSPSQARRSYEVEPRPASKPRTEIIAMAQAVRERLKPAALWIEGDEVAAHSEKSYPVYEPAYGEVLAEVAEGGAEDIDRAVRAARRAFDEGAWT